MKIRKKSIKTGLPVTKVDCEQKPRIYSSASIAGKPNVGGSFAKE